jgi:hypothetical protein
VEPGQTAHFFKQTSDVHVSNNTAPGLIYDGTLVVMSLGLRLLGLTCDQEDVLLDHFVFDLIVGDKSQGPWPGTVCSTLRALREDAPTLPIPKEEAHLYSPGYILKTPIIIPVKMGAGVLVEVSEKLPRPVSLRALLFTLHARDGDRLADEPRRPDAKPNRDATSE